MSEPFIISAALKERLRKSQTAATLAVQLSAAIPHPEIQTLASPSPQMTRLNYSAQVFIDGAVGYWHMGPFSDNGFDFVTYFNALIMRYTVTPQEYFGYLLPFTGTLNAGNVLFGDGVISTAVDDVALSIGATDGLTISYFPVVGVPAGYFPGSLDADVDEDFTWELWIKTAQSPGAEVLILEQEAAGVYPYRIQLLPSGSLRASRSDGTLTCQVDSAQVVNDDDWHYVAVYKDGAIYGVAVDDNAATTTPDTLVGQATPGSTTLLVDGAIAGDGFIGAIDELALYPLALTAQQRFNKIGAAAGVGVPV